MPIESSTGSAIHNFEKGTEPRPCQTDHFNAEAVAAHLSRSPEDTLISSVEIVQRVHKAAPGVQASQRVAVTPDPGTSIATALDDGVRVHVLRIRHNDARRMPEQHVGFLVGLTRR